MTRRWMAVVLLVVLSACGDDATPTATPGGSVPSTTEEFFAFVVAVDESHLTFDPAEFLTGDAAHDAAVAGGVIGEDEELPNDFFIANPAEDSETATLSAAGAYVLLGFDENQAIEEVEVDRDELVAALNDGEGYYGIVAGETPMMLVTSGGEVIAATQVYLP